ncbi:MAG: metal ABC transporter permease [Paracoccaceae bacterium]|nr:metal ABC transporter permease [Paracoccaceae bacterium]
MLFEALTLGLGYNASLVTLGAAALGMAAGVTGTFLYLRKRALVSDAISHATLPGIAAAFMLAVALGGDGRGLPVLLLGSAVSAALGLLAVQWLASRTRLTEDAAIGAVLSVFFGFGVVLLTVIQTLSTGRQAGLEDFLLGATAGMLRSEALLIAVGGLVTLAIVVVLRRPMLMTAFDPSHASAMGVNLTRTDIAMMGLVMAVTVVGLKIVGLILIVALLIIPPVAARFWSDRADRVVLLAGVVGGVAGWVGAAFSATAADLPTGPMIVLAAFALFCLSFLLAPGRGLMAAALRAASFRTRVHLRQGLLAIANDQPIYETLTLRLLARRGLALPDGVPTEAGRAAAARARLDEERWAIVRADPSLELAAARYDGLTPLEDVLTVDQISEIDARRPAPEALA